MLYAAYGSNLHPLRLYRRLATARLRGTAFLANWSLRFHKLSTDGSGKCSIQSGSSGVYCAIYDISKADKRVLDGIEGLGRGYSEISMDVPDFGPCFSYTASDTHIDNSLIPYDWYKQLVLAGALAHGFPPSYVEQVRSTASRQDPDPARHREMWDLVNLIEVQGLDLAGERITPPTQ